MNAIEINNLEKKYKNFKLGSIDLNIPSGMIVGLIGENGAGKTTLIKSILNIIKVDNGSIKIFDKDISKYDELVKEDIGVVLDNMFFPEILSPKNINSIMQDIYKNWDRDLFYDYLERFGINDNQQLKTMSKGMRKKVEIATALAHKPKLLIMDEATSGLDPVVRNEVLDIFLDFIQNEENTVVLSSHITSDLEEIADQIVFIDSGKIILNKNKDEILDNYGILKCDIDSFYKIDHDDIVKYRKTKYSYEILVSDKKKIKKKYKDYIVDNVTLENLMLIIIKGEI